VLAGEIGSTSAIYRSRFSKVVSILKWFKSESVYCNLYKQKCCRFICALCPKEQASKSSGSPKSRFKSGCLGAWVQVYMRVIQSTGYITNHLLNFTTSICHSNATLWCKYIRREVRIASGFQFWYEFLKLVDRLSLSSIRPSQAT